jgi:hypothetical protein
MPPAVRAGWLGHEEVLQGLACSHYSPMIAPWTAVPFFSSTVTVSLDSFIRNLSDKEDNKG